MDTFWKEIAKEVGAVPKIIKIILVQVDYIHAGLGMLNDDAIRDIEKDVRMFPETSGKSEEEWRETLGYYGNIREFQFTAGQRSVLKVIANTVERNGITKFCKALIRAETHPDASSAPCSTPAQSSAVSHASTIRDKIVHFFEHKYISIFSYCFTLDP